MDVFKWLRGRWEAARRQEDDVEALFGGYGNDACREACRRERDAGMAETTSYHGGASEHWGMVALLLADRIEALENEAEKRSKLDTAIRMMGF